MNLKAAAFFKDDKRWKLVNMKIIAFCSHHATIYSTDLRKPTTHENNTIYIIT